MSKVKLRRKITKTNGWGAREVNINQLPNLIFGQGSSDFKHIAMILLVFQVVAFVLVDELICVQDRFVVLIALRSGSVLPLTPNHDNSSLRLWKSFLGNTQKY